MNQPAINNAILRALPTQEWQRLQPHLQLMEWPLDYLIQKAGEPVKHVAFPQEGLLSAILMSDQNVGVETGTTGAEGQSGAHPVLANAASQSTVTVSLFQPLLSPPCWACACPACRSPWRFATGRLYPTHSE